MNALLALIARLAEANLITEEVAADLTTRLEAVEPIDADTIEGVATSDDTAEAEVAAIAALGNAEPELLDEVQATLRSVGEQPAASVADLVECADWVAGLGFVTDTQDEIARHDAEEREAVLARLAPPAAEASNEGGDEGDGDGGDEAPVEPTAETPPEGEAAPEDAPVAEPVMAAGIPARPRAGAIGQRRGTPTPPPDTRPARQFLRLSPLGDPISEHEIPEDQFVAAVEAALDSFKGGRAVDERFIKLGRLRGPDYPEERRLGRDPHRNGEIVTEQLDAWREEARRATSPAEAVQRAITASGGICAPVQPLYDYMGVGTTRRPVRDFLPSFNAERGGISWRTPLKLSSFGTPTVNSTTSGVTQWTAANDLSPSDPSTKVVFTVPCPSTNEKQIYAIVARVKHGNFMAMYDPETIANAVRLQEIAQARIADRALLTGIDAGSVVIDELANQLGASRDVLNVLDRLAVAERRRQRMEDNEVIDLIGPSWVRNAMIADRVEEIPGASTDQFRRAASDVDAEFSVRGFRVAWEIDGDMFASQSANTDPSPFPNRATFRMFDQGHHVRLDGGRLDFGIERSPTLNDTNDAQFGSEEMENVASRGIFSYKINLAICVSGATASTVQTGCAS